MGPMKTIWKNCNIVFTRLEERGFRANVRKCFFARDSLEYLGYWLTTPRHPTTTKESGSDMPTLCPTKSSPTETFPWHGKLLPRYVAAP